MISLEYKDMCKGCPLSDLELTSIRAGVGKLWSVACTHELACTRWQSKVSKEGEQDDMDESLAGKL